MLCDVQVMMQVGLRVNLRPSSRVSQTASVSTTYYIVTASTTVRTGLMNVAATTQVNVFRPWFNTLIPRSHCAHPWSFDTDGCTRVDLRHAWLDSGYTTLDSMLEIGSTSATVE